MAIRLTGLSGGFDASGVIEQLVSIARQPIVEAEQKKLLVDQATSTVNAFSSRLSSFRSAALALSDTSGYASYGASSSDPAVVASASGGAQAGSYAVAVTQLASAQKLRSSTFASSSTALGLAGQLTVQVGSQTAVNVAVTAADTLSDVASKLAASGARITASVLYDGTSYRLSLQGADSGAANAFTVSQSGLDLGLADPANVYQTAKDAMLTVDGMAITRSTNSISGVIPGVTMALTKTVPSATVTVASDTTAIKQKLATFVSTYNDIVNAAHNATGYGTTKATNAELAGDSSIRRALDGLARLVTSAVPGASGAYTTLGSVGLKLGSTGTLSLDAAKLDAAIAKDPDGVRRLFVTDPSLGATGVMKTFGTFVDGLVTGNKSPMKARVEALGAKSRRYLESIEKKEMQTELYETQLRKQYAALDQAMSRYQSMSAAVGSMGSGSST